MKCDKVKLVNAEKRSSRNSESLRELSVGARQYRRSFELALEQSVERYSNKDISRRERVLTVISGGYKTVMSVSVRVHTICMN